MTHEQCSRLIREISYKPGWRLGPTWLAPLPADVVDSDYAGHLTGYGFSIHVRTIDPETSEPQMFIHVRRVEAPYMTDAAAFIRGVFRELMAVEEHEAGEYFTWQGAKPFCPHRPAWPPSAVGLEGVAPR